MSWSFQADVILMIFYPSPFPHTHVHTYFVHKSEHQEKKNFGQLYSAPLCKILFISDVSKLKSYSDDSWLC